jgi:hypothetical protein
MWEDGLVVFEHALGRVRTECNVECAWAEVIW